MDEKKKICPIMYRHELKYICENMEMGILERKLKSIMHPDEHTDEKGRYVIRSVYFDDYSRTCYYENENGQNPREKFRIRIYNCSNKVIFLEKKIKKQGMTGKRSCRINQGVCMKMLTGGNMREEFGKEPLLDEWILERQTRLLRPVMLGEYIRIPLVYRLGNVRITMDKNISASRQATKIFDDDISKIAVLPSGYHVLEVKYDDFLPDIIYQLIDNGHLRQTTFSKFYLGCLAIGGNINEIW